MELLRSSVRFLNSPPIKEGIKNYAGSLTFAFGIAEIYDIYHSLSNKTTGPKWKLTAGKIILISAKLSLILSAAVSRPGVWLISTLAECVAGPLRLEQMFGSSQTFLKNPWHPRHVISIAAVIFALPSLVKPIKEDENSKLPFMTAFNVITSRPILHLGNCLGRSL
jgi:hypothetical protein